MERALALEARLAGPLVATPYLVHQLVWCGEVGPARDALARWSSWGRSRQTIDVADAAWYLALLEFRHGDWDAAAAAASTAVSVTDQFGREANTITAWPAAVIAAHRADLDHARALAERGLDAITRPDIAEAGFQWVRGFIELSCDDAGRALTHLLDAERIYAPLEIGEPSMQWFMPDLLEALVAVGELDRAEQTLAPFAQLGRNLDRPWALAVAARSEAVLLAVRGDVDGAVARFAEALAQDERAPDRFQRGRTMLALGVTQRRAKQRRAARETLEQALTTFTELPAPLWAAKARAELARIGGRAPSRGELTEGERRIATRVAEGMTNRQVAAALFLTEHSVETALSRVYRKLGVRSRTELARRLAGTTED